jgi:hypothetical protein
MQNGLHPQDGLAADEHFDIPFLNGQKDICTNVIPDTSRKNCRSKSDKTTSSMEEWDDEKTLDKVSDAERKVSKYFVGRVNGRSAIQ